MTDHYDALETREAAQREAELFSRLPDVLRKAMMAPVYAERLKCIDSVELYNRANVAPFVLVDLKEDRAHVGA
jgi:phenylacetate-CoA ligase